MRARFLLFPAALIAPAPAQAYQPMTLQQAQAALFPGATFTPHDVILTNDQVAALMREIDDQSVDNPTIKAWKVSTGGWFFLDQVPGRDDIITYAVGIGADGAVTGVEIMECLPKYDGIQKPAWLRQFAGRHYERNVSLADEIDIISGTSLSSLHIADGVRRMLAAYALFFARGG